MCKSDYMWALNHKHTVQPLFLSEEQDKSSDIEQQPPFGDRK